MRFKDLRNLGLPAPKPPPPEITRRTPFFGYTVEQKRAIDVARADAGRAPLRVVSTRPWRSEHYCCWCGGPFSSDVFSPFRRTREHLTPLSHGGITGWGNLAASHLYCNNLRGSNTRWVLFVRWDGPRILHPNRALVPQRRRCIL